MSLDTAAVDARILAVVGEDVTYLPSGGGSSTVTAFYQEPDVQIDSLELEMEASGPRISVLSDDAPNASQDDQWVVRGTTYDVTRVEREETSLLVIHLEEA